MRTSPSRVPRFYFDADLHAGSLVALSPPAEQHARALRLRPGAAIVLFNGGGGEFDARLVTTGRHAVEVLAWREVERESALAVTLVQGVSSGEKMDFTVQKAVELGVAALQPVLTRKALVRLSGARAGAKHAHWQRIAIAACEQCGRNRVPEVLAPLTLEAYCRKAAPAAARIVLSLRGERALKDLVPAAGAAIALAAGPEAGFDDSEEALLERAGFVPVRLGPRVLRSETAALAALAALQAVAGDF